VLLNETIVKLCGKCNRTYQDNTLSFCLEDGSPLTIAYDPDATLQAPTRNLKRTQSDPPIEFKTPGLKTIVLTVGLVLLVLAVLAVFGALFKGEVPPTSGTSPSIGVQLKTLVLLLFRLAIVVGVPLVPTVVFWKVADNYSWEIWYSGFVRFALVAIYLVFGLAALAVLFPDFFVSQWLWQVLH